MSVSSEYDILSNVTAVICNFSFANITIMRYGVFFQWLHGFYEPVLTWFIPLWWWQKRPSCVCVCVSVYIYIYIYIYIYARTRTHTHTHEMRQFNSRKSRSVSLGCWVRQTRVLRYIWTCSNLRLHEPHTKWVVRSRAAEEVERVRGIRLAVKRVTRIWSSG